MNAPVTAWVAPGDIQPVDEHGADAVRYKRGDLVDRLIEAGVVMAEELRDYADAVRTAGGDCPEQYEKMADDFDDIVYELDGLVDAQRGLDL
jgi:hypothetical protein